MAEKSVSVSRPVGELHVGVNVDCGKAIKGLKALQRELKETIKLTKELEGRPDGNTFVVDSNVHIAEYSFRQEGRYIVLDFGEATNNDIKLKLEGFGRIVNTFVTDVI